MIPIFVGGTGRSGTTILKKIFTQHTKIVSLPCELRVIIDPDGALDLVSDLTDRWSPYHADLALHKFRQLLLDGFRARSKAAVFVGKIERSLLNRLGISSRRYPGLGLAYYFGIRDIDQRIDVLIDSLSFHVSSGSWAGSLPYRINSKLYDVVPGSRANVAQIVAQFFDEIYMNMAQDAQTHWLEDTPYNILYADELSLMFPEMRLLHIFRDPRDVLASYRGFAWGGDDFVASARRLAGIYQRWSTVRENLPQGCILEISLEKVSASPEAELARICNFIGLEFEDALLAIQLNKVNVGRWKVDIPESEWEAIHRVLSKYIVEYGSRL